MSSLAVFTVLILCLVTDFLPLVHADIGYFWHVTDFHYDDTYLDAALSCNPDLQGEGQPGGVKGQFGDYWCDSPWTLVSDSIKAMREVKKDVDFLIYTGDTVAHISDSNLTLDGNLQIMHNITSALMREFPNTTVYPSLGNHDFFPSGQAQPVMDEMYDRVGEMWRDWIGDPAVDTFRKGGYYAVQIQPKVRLLGLNTNLYYTSNHVTQAMEAKEDPAGQFAWMGEQLAEAETTGQHVIVTGHVPVGLLSPHPTQWFYAKFIDPFLDVIYKFSHVITAMHFGHNHCDNCIVLQKNVSSSQAVPQFMAPSVTPWTFKMPGYRDPPRNPAIRLVKYDRSTGQHLDFDQYFINLTDSNTQGYTQWTKLYTFTTAYGVSDMSVTSLRSLFNKILAKTDSREAVNICRYTSVSQHLKTCTREMQLEIACAGLHPRFEDAQRCWQSEKTESSSTNQNGCFVTAALATVLAVLSARMAILT